jgi:hypothetical protein
MLFVGHWPTSIRQPAFLPEGATPGGRILSMMRLSCHRAPFQSRLNFGPFSSCVCIFFMALSLSEHMMREENHCTAKKDNAGWIHHV